MTRDGCWWSATIGVSIRISPAARTASSRAPRTRHPLPDLGRARALRRQPPQARHDLRRELFRAAGRRVRIPTLAAVLELVRRVKADHVRFNVETKITPTWSTRPTRTFAAAVASLKNRTGLAAGSCQSFDWRTLWPLCAASHPHRARGLTIDGGNADTLQRGRPGASRGRQDSTSTISTARRLAWYRPRLRGLVAAVSQRDAGKPGEESLGLR